MDQNYELPHAIDMERELLSAMLIRRGEIIPKVSNIVTAEDFYRPEHQIIFRVILELYAQGNPSNSLGIWEEVNKSKDRGKIDFSYLKYVELSIHTNAYAVGHAKIIKEKSELRRLMLAGEVLTQTAQLGLKPLAEIIAEHQIALDAINQSSKPLNKSSFKEYFADLFDGDVDEMKIYADRKTGFVNLDEHQYFTPGLYVIGATPAAGKTTFCWQLLEQLARQGENCVYYTYEMSRLELYAKSLARELFKRDEQTTLTAAQIRRGAHSQELRGIVKEFATTTLNLNVFELQDETVDDLLKLLKPLCTDKAKAPVVCLDYLQIMPTGRESTKLGIDETVRKLKKFQRDTNTTFIVISSFNRTNYAQTVSFESFKDSGNIEYTADVVWALQLNVINEIKGGELVSETRRKIDEAKKQQPRQIHLKCLKNRQGTNYDCYFEYHSAHDYFEPCESFDEIDLPSQTNQKDDAE
ncbi:MAG: hypothetical protein IKN16_07115 [Selenomonadaceae bacterium]|nr:hypothetical protein [Selenomonadaceae bacterium]MBR6888202.1 hypothetical protein [Selenomonadaceae bacterium]